DGFRFELAKDLIDELKSDAVNTIETNTMLASIPSYTNLGMSNLLPNDGIEAITTDSTIDYTINGIKTISSNREKILQMVEPDALVLDYANFMRMSVSEQRELLKPARLVYIYHNWMDAIGDKRSSEYYTFEAVEQCIDQLKLLIKKLYNSLNTYYIYVTADHGFLFNYNEIKENSRQAFPNVKTCLKEHTRFCITEDQIKSKDIFSVPLKNTTNIDTDVRVLLPKGINRFKKLGGFGVQFVHGGASIQELIVPVVQLSRKRNAKLEDVSFMRIDNVKAIAASTSKFKILQEKAVGDNFQAITILVALYDIQNNRISNEVEIVLNSIDESPSERSIEFKLELNASGSRVKTGYLRAYNKKDTEQLNPMINDLIKINTLTEIDDFS
ncbi:MAG TPA: BREX-1 system phosphatase PglZ type A, partial [Flavobacteriaceae bacterium]|nr:BREX-1 system phosphatase PglZ type A [Flavobacteriaceae bacterium]